MRFLFSSRDEDGLMLLVFTGIIEETGKVLSLTRSAAGAQLVVRAKIVAENLRIGDSVAINGCCLTVTHLENNELSFDLLNETLHCANLEDAHTGSSVNLERALAANGRIGGHFVQGHIDCATPVISNEQVGADTRLEISLPSQFARYVVAKGSIAVNGISLTVAEVTEISFIVWVIPHTMEITNLRSIKTGERVNLEFDMLAKYVERILGRS